ncbi:hypothetical protein H5410_031147 [Solanum commersonii]|uniref:Uncharacterized protein n=1 Tax=Solanum commersonii TaxID=4109 RepID=A0A9J5YHM8_SOLCO|nr:hypothetical protein H5410_031147 [Solanum commersonii]
MQAVTNYEIFSGQLINRNKSRIYGLQTKILSYGGKVTLIKYVLVSLPIHLLISVSPLSNILIEIEKLTAYFLGHEKFEEKIPLGILGNIMSYM